MEEHPDEHGWWGLLVDLIVAVALIMVIVTGLGVLILWLA